MICTLANGTGWAASSKLAKVPEACAIRETYEESGLQMIDPVLRVHDHLSRFRR